MLYATLVSKTTPMNRKIEPIVLFSDQFGVNKLRLLEIKDENRKNGDTNLVR